MSRLGTFLLAVAAMQMTACGQPEDLAGAKAASSAYIKAVNDDDSTAFFRWLDEDLELIPPNAPPLRGEAARKIFRDLFAGFEVEKAEFFDEEWSRGTEVAVGRYSYRLRLKPRNGGEPAEESGSGVHVWRRGKDGQWRLAKDIWSVPAPAQKAL